MHNTTVSLALRNNPVIPEATRKRIQALAEQMGYHPDPALRALVAYRKGRIVADRRETIAYITNADTRWGWRSQVAEELFYAGATRKAAQYGYQLEHFWLGEPNMSQRRLSDMLFHRGITGVLLASHRAECDELLDFDWSRVSAVKIGCFLHAPALHRVTNDQQAAVGIAMKQITSAGYRRVGLVLPAAWDAAADRAWSSGFLIEQNCLPASSRIPIFFQRAVPGGAAKSEHHARREAARLTEWFNEFRPEAILSSGAIVADLLAEPGSAVPRDVGFIDLFLNRPNGCIAGVRHHSERVGEVATEMLINLMQQNLCGIPSIPMTTLLPGVWCDGESLPSIAPRQDAVSEPLVWEERCDSYV